MTLKHTLTCSVCLVLSVAPARAALLQDISGNVVVNRGEGFEPVKGSVELATGDQVVVGPGGTATLSYGGGCNVPVAPEAVVSVSAKAPCPPAKPGQVVGQQVPTHAVNPGGVQNPGGAPVDPIDPDAPADPNAANPVDGGGFGGMSGTTLAVVGGAAVAIGVGVAIAVNSKSASP